MVGIALPMDYDESDEVPEFPALQHRLAQLGLMMTDGNALGALSGLRPGAAPDVSIADGVLTVQPFACIVDPGGSQGPYLCVFTESEDITLTAAPGSNSRKDRVDVQVPSDPPTGDRVATLVYTDTGTAASNPTAPAAPDRSTNVGFVTVPSSGSAVWSAGTEFTVAAGGILPAAASGFTGSYVGQYIDDPDDGLCRWDGSAWTTPRPGGAWSGIRNTGASIPGDGTWTDVPMTTQTVRVGGPWLFIEGTHSGPGIVEDGTYMVSGSVAFPTTDVSKIRGCRIQINSTTEVIGTRNIGAMTGPASGAAVVNLSAGDVIRLQAYQNSGSSASTTSSLCGLSVVRLA